MLIEKLWEETTRTLFPHEGKFSSVSAENIQAFAKAVIDKFEQEVCEAQGSYDNDGLNEFFNQARDVMMATSESNLVSPTHATIAPRRNRKSAMSAVAVAAKVEPQACPGCGAVARVDHQGSKWKVWCSMNKTVLSDCQKSGHTMGSRKEAVRVWNESK